MSKCSKLSNRRVFVSRKPIGIWKRYETSCLIRKSKQGWGGDVWNSEQPLPVANVSSLFFRDRASVSSASKFLARRTTAFSTAYLVARTAGKPTSRKVSLNEACITKDRSEVDPFVEVA